MMVRYPLLVVPGRMSASGGLTRVPVIALEYGASAAGDMALAKSGRGLRHDGVCG